MKRLSLALLGCAAVVVAAGAPMQAQPVEDRSDSLPFGPSGARLELLALIENAEGSSEVQALYVGAKAELERRNQVKQVLEEVAEGGLSGRTLVKVLSRPEAEQIDELEARLRLWDLIDTAEEPSEVLTLYLGAKAQLQRLEKVREILEGVSAGVDAATSPLSVVVAASCEDDKADCQLAHKFLCEEWQGPQVPDIDGPGGLCDQLEETCDQYPCAY